MEYQIEEMQALIKKVLAKLKCTKQIGYKEFDDWLQDGHYILLKNNLNEPSGYAYRTVYNYFINILNQDKIKTTADIDMFYNIAIDELGYLKIDINDIYLNLNSDDKKLFKLIYFGFKNNEIAKYLNISISKISKFKRWLKNDKGT